MKLKWAKKRVKNKTQNTKRKKKGRGGDSVSFKNQNFLFYNPLLEKKKKKRNKKTKEKR